MSEKPILFKTEMVQAILDGRKTMTRRVIKPQPTCCGPNLKFSHDPILSDFFLSAEHNRLQCRRCGHFPEYSREGVDIAHYWIPKYKPGDILWVMETWLMQSMKNSDKTAKVLFKAVPNEILSNAHFTPKRYEKFLKYAGKIGWQSPYFLPHEAARIYLKITNIRVERIQDVSDDDCRSEGIKGYTKDNKLYKYAASDDWWIDYSIKHKKSFKGTWWQVMPKTPKDAFMYLWNSTIKKQDIEIYGWEANPWVWVIEFERMINYETKS